MQAKDLLASFLRWHAVSARGTGSLSADADGRAFHSFPNLWVVLSARSRHWRSDGHKTTSYITAANSGRPHCTALTACSLSPPSCSSSSSSSSSIILSHLGTVASLLTPLSLSHLAKYHRHKNFILYKKQNNSIQNTVIA